MKKLGIKSSFASLFKLLKQVGKHRFMYTMSLIISVIGDLGFNAAFAFGSMYIVQGLENANGQIVRNGVVFLVITTVSVMGVIYIGSRLFNAVVARVSGNLRQNVFDHVCKLPVSWFEDRHSGDILSRLTNDIQAAEKAWGRQLVIPLTAIVDGIGCATMMLLLHWQMGLIAIGIGAVMLFIGARFIAPIKRASDDAQSKMSVTTQRLVDILASAKVARIFNLSGYLLSKLDEASGDVYKSEMHRRRWQAGQAAANSYGNTMSFIGLILIGGIFIANGKLTLAELMAISQLSNGVGYMFWALSNTLGAFQQSLAGAERVMEVLDTPVEETNVLTASQGDHAVTLDNISFDYEEGTQVLTQVQEAIRSGETVALVGGSGSGKSTILKLIMGFYQPKEGDIMVQGEGRQDIAYVPQTNYLFAGTIRDNIAYGREDATEEDVIAAAKAAMAHDFIMAMENGYDTMVGERGSRLSGGQRQRIAIARAIVKNAPILLLDEATSSLDSEAERLVQQAIDRLIEGRTSVIVAHRLSTIRHADRILVLEGGRVVEKGRHEELLQKEGRYAYYYNLQFENQQAS